VILCAGKVYFDLDVARRARGITDVALLRLEQLYPLSKEELTAALAPYRDGTPLVWVQEDPANMGAWYFLAARLPGLLGGRLPAVLRGPRRERLARHGLARLPQAGAAAHPRRSPRLTVKKLE
jgi:2-oxoglutarate dehydrogenase complex dehydrogenase (E1) component-like enzyme